jgi:hypothetical protein
MLRAAWLDAVRRRVQIELHQSEKRVEKRKPLEVEMDAKKKWFDHCKDDVCHQCFLP